MKLLARLRWPLLILLVLAALWLGRGAWLPLFSRALDVGQPPRQADVIVLLGGGRLNRARAAAHLYGDGYAPRVIVSGEATGEDEADCTAEIADEYRLKQLGVPDSAILFNCPAYSTIDEVEGVLRLIDQAGAHSALVVSDSYHTRRVRATFRHLLAGREDPLELTYYGATPPYSEDRWWLTDEGLVTVQNEYLKLIYYLLAHGVWPF